MKRPSFQFYPADLRNNVKLRRCSWAARGVWLEVMCLLHDSDEYGILRWTLEEIALAVGCQRELVTELVDKGVLKGTEKVGDKVSFSESFSQRNAPSISIVLIDNEPSPLWYSSRMVRDEYVRLKRGGNGVKSLENPNVPRKKGSENRQESAPKTSEDKDTFSPSPTSSSSSSSTSTSSRHTTGVSSVGAHGSQSLAPHNTSAPALDRSSQKTGTRLPDDWVLPKRWGEWAIQEKPGWSVEYIRKVSEQFRDHWIAKAGRDATKRNWLAAWRYWVRNQRDPSVSLLQPRLASKQTQIAEHNRAVAKNWKPRELREATQDANQPGEVIDAIQ